MCLSHGLRPRQETPHQVYSGKGAALALPTVSPEENLGVPEFEGQVLGGDEGNLLGRYRPRTMFSNGYLTRPFEYNTDSGPRYCRRMSD